MIYTHLAATKKNGSFDIRRQQQAKYWMYETINEQLRSRFYNSDGMEQLLTGYEQQLLEGKITSFAAAAKLLDIFDSKK